MPRQVTTRRRLKIGGAILLSAAAVVLGISAPALANGGPTPPPSHARPPKAIPVPVPSIAGPVVTLPHLDGTHGQPYTSSPVDLQSAGYTEQEYFVSGTARSYLPDGTFTTDGNWKVTPSTSAAYKTRIIVRKPIDMSKFSGNVVVEWLNASDGRDLDVGWTFGSTALMNDHDIYVGVSAQEVVVDGATESLQAWDPARYGSLKHPGDQYSYDIFSQVAQALRTPTKGVNPIAGGRIHSLVAYGDSQSAARLTTYADALQNRDQVFDGIFINSRGAVPAPLNVGLTEPAGTKIRSDITAKVFTLETESDVINGTTGYVSARQPDSSNFRLWEVAGSSHIDAVEEALQRVQAFREWPLTQPPLQLTTCTQPTGILRFNDVEDTIFHIFPEWIANDRYAPPTVDRLKVNAAQTGYVQDSLGLSEGGLQLPQVTVPTGSLSGLRTNTGTSSCPLSGTYTAFSSAQLKSLYPSHQSYVAKYTSATDRLVKQHFIQPYDAAADIDAAQNSAIPALTYVP